MSLTTLIDQIDTLVTKRAKTSKIKPLLIALRDQAEACELHISQLQAEAQSPVLKTENDSLRGQLEKAQKEILKMKAYYATPPVPFVKPSAYS
jgi:hypothetical protein